MDNVEFYTQVRNSVFAFDVLEISKPIYTEMLQLRLNTDIQYVSSSDEYKFEILKYIKFVWWFVLKHMVEIVFTDNNLSTAAVIIEYRGIYFYLIVSKMRLFSLIINNTIVDVDVVRKAIRNLPKEDRLLYYRKSGTTYNMYHIYANFVNVAGLLNICRSCDDDISNGDFFKLQFLTYVTGCTSEYLDSYRRIIMYEFKKSIFYRNVYEVYDIINPTNVIVIISEKELLKILSDTRMFCECCFSCLYN